MNALLYLHISQRILGIDYMYLCIFVYNIVGKGPILLTYKMLLLNFFYKNINHMSCFPIAIISYIFFLTSPLLCVTIFSICINKNYYLNKAYFFYCYNLSHISLSSSTCSFAKSASSSCICSS